MEKLLGEFSIPTSASFADLGAGRGRLGLFLTLVRGQKRVLGVEFHPLMVQRAEKVRRWLKIRNLLFVHADWVKVPLDSIDVVYMYGLVIDDEASMRLTRHMSLLQEGTKIITISSWLGETMPGSFRLEKKLPVRFEWGETEAFLQTVVWPK
jgi:predicted RNA methylase